LLDSSPEVILNDVKLHDLLSGDITTIDINGTFLVRHRIPAGERNRYIEFWANNTTVRFEKNSETFEIIDVPDLLFIDFN
jgi:hypothetical protein